MAERGFKRKLVISEHDAGPLKRFRNNKTSNNKTPKFGITNASTQTAIEFEDYSQTQTVNFTVNLLDIPLDCFLIILKDADIWELLRVAKTSSLLKFYAEEAFYMHRRSIVIDNSCMKSSDEIFELIQYFGHLATSISIDLDGDIGCKYRIERILALIGSRDPIIERLEIFNVGVLNMNVLQLNEQLLVYKIMCQLNELKLTNGNLQHCELLFHFAKNTVETITFEDCLMDSTTKGAIVHQWLRANTFVIQDQYGTFSDVDILAICRQNKSVKNWIIIRDTLPSTKLLAGTMCATKELTLKVSHLMDLMPLAALANLNKLTLNGRTSNRVNVAPFLRALRTHTKLQELELHQVTCFEFPEMTMPERSFINLKTLKVTAFNLHPFQRLILNLVNLERIELNGSAFSMNNLRQIFQSLPNLQMAHINIVDTPGYCIIIPPYKSMLELCRAHSTAQKNLLIVLNRGFHGNPLKARSFGRAVLFYPSDVDTVADTTFDFGTEDEFERAKAIADNKLTVSIRQASPKISI